MLEASAQTGVPITHQARLCLEVSRSVEEAMSKHAKNSGTTWSKIVKLDRVAFAKLKQDLLGAMSGPIRDWVFTADRSKFIPAAIGVSGFTTEELIRLLMIRSTMLLAIRTAAEVANIQNPTMKPRTRSWVCPPSGKDQRWKISCQA
jgi:hypothetical protein